MKRLIPSFAWIVILANIVLFCSVTQPQDAPLWKADVPKTWDEQQLSTMELPLPDAEASPKHVSADYYYKMPVRPVYKTYSIYDPENEPAGYMDWLQKQEPQIVFDETKLKTKQDWIAAGQLVFEAPIEYLDSGESLFKLVRDKNWYKENGVLITRDHVFPNMQYVIREKGKVELGILACAQCHTRVMPDGTTISGAQGNFPDDRAFGYEIALDVKNGESREKVLKSARDFMIRTYAAPWISGDINSRAEKMSIDDIVAVLRDIPPGACARQGSSAFFPAHIPDLIGLQERRYFDASGRVQHRSIGDLMRYAALNQGADMLSSYGSFRPRGELPDPTEESRYSDEQLYALSLYLYSITPPPSPYPFDARAAHGKVIFEKAGCVVCHAAPLFTNNELTPAAEFEVPPDHKTSYDILNMPVDTDSTLTLKTRRGSGYYKVPSLKGVWYRGPFGHNGTVPTLEDWFDPRRTKDDYVPAGSRTPRAVQGHTFGMSLSSEEREELIAYLKTL